MGPRTEDGDPTPLTATRQEDELRLAQVEAQLKSLREGEGLSPS